VPEVVNIGIIGGGLMGRELAAAIGRWSALEDHPASPRLTAVCDPNPTVLSWFERIDTVTTRTADHRELLARDDVDVVYIAVPHHLHEEIYLDTVAAGKDFLGEKPFGIDVAAAAKIVDALDARPDVFARCSSEMPYFPGALRAFGLVASGALGTIIEAQSTFWHSSDLDVNKPINWKRQVKACGEIGVMGDLGMHTLHLPLRLGWVPERVYGVLQDLVPTRPAAAGSSEQVPCDTIENATLLCTVADVDGSFPLTLEQKRIAPGEKNTWRFRAAGMDGAVEFSTRYPKTLRRMTIVDGEQIWQEVEMGSQSAFATVTGGIFEFGFSDAILQMWAAFLAERAGALGDRLGCVTPAEALTSHRLFDAARRSAARFAAEPLVS
jgi:predicted dehydrogenase